MFPNISIIMDMYRDISTMMEICDTMQSERGDTIRYKETIIAMVEKIHDAKLLERIYKFVRYLYTYKTDD